MRTRTVNYTILSKLIGAKIVDVMEDENDGCPGLKLEMTPGGPAIHLWFLANDDLMEPGTFLVQTMKG